MKSVYGSLSLALLLFVSTGCQSAGQQKGSLELRGRVVLTSEMPDLEGWFLDNEMQEASGEVEFTDESILVSESGGLANCVISAHPVGVRTELEPTPDAVFSKIGPRYVPRVLPITEGTRVEFRNVDSPCRGFMARTFTTSFNTMIEAGQQFDEKFPRRGVVPITCDLREYMRGAVVVLDTEHFVVTDAEGTWNLGVLPAGDYDLRLWHERLGKKSVSLGTRTVADGRMEPIEYELEL